MTTSSSISVKPGRWERGVGAQPPSAVNGVKPGRWGRGTGDGGREEVARGKCKLHIACLKLRIVDMLLQIANLRSRNDRHRPLAPRHSPLASDHSPLAGHFLPCGCMIRLARTRMIPRPFAVGCFRALLQRMQKPTTSAVRAKTQRLHRPCCRLRSLAEGCMSCVGRSSDSREEVRPAFSPRSLGRKRRQWPQRKDAPERSVTAAGTVPESHRVPCTSALPVEAADHQRHNKTDCKVFGGRVK